MKCNTGLKWFTLFLVACLRDDTHMKSIKIVPTLQQTMQQQPHHAYEQTKSKQNQVMSHSNWPHVLLLHLAHNVNGAIKR